MNPSTPSENGFAQGAVVPARAGAEPLIGLVLEMDAQDVVSLAPLRLRTDLEIAPVGEGSRVWIRCQRPDESLKKACSLLPAIARYDWLPPDRLRKVRSRISAQRLPPLSWQSLASFLEPRLPDLLGAGQLTEAAEIGLVRSGCEAPPTLMRCCWADWAEFALNAPVVRLRGLKYAVASPGEVIVHGHPLPALRGELWVDHGGIAVPCGYRWEPEVSLDVLERCFRKPSGGFILWFADGYFVRLHPEQFMEVTRSSVRRTGMHWGLGLGQGEVEA